MQAKNVLYAAVGAPVVAARKFTDVFGDLKTKINDETSDYSKVANQAFETWASEGEKVVARVSDNKTVEEIAAKVDLDQVQEQVGKLRTQLEDMLATWRTSFRPERAGEKAETTVATKPAAKTVAKKPAAKMSTTAKKPAAKTSAAKTSAAKTTKASAAKKSTAAKSANAS